MKGGLTITRPTDWRGRIACHVTSDHEWRQRVKRAEMDAARGPIGLFVWKVARILDVDFEHRPNDFGKNL